MRRVMATGRSKLRPNRYQKRFRPHQSRRTVQIRLLYFPVSTSPGSPSSMRDQNVARPLGRPTPGHTRSQPHCIDISTVTLSCSPCCHSLLDVCCTVSIRTSAAARNRLPEHHRSVRSTSSATQRCLHAAADYEQVAGKRASTLADTWLHSHAPKLSHEGSYSECSLQRGVIIQLRSVAFY